LNVTRKRSRRDGRRRALCRWTPAMRIDTTGTVDRFELNEDLGVAAQQAHHKEGQERDHERQSNEGADHDL
jgi:hypothetical protein